ncbi:MAG: hypothetical protein J7J76_03920 [Candidatus Latescibacteria bacterium]|nr:hypothetical protein [Candidatus Latescibacterota bacterium]
MKLLDRRGLAVEGFRMDGAVDLEGNAVAEQVRRQGSLDVRKMPGAPAHLPFACGQRSFMDLDL